MVLLIILAVVVAGVGFVAFFGAPYVPSHASQVKRAFTALRPLTKHDVLVDLGSGDGVVLRQAIAQGAGKAIGFELHPVLVWISRLASARYGSVIQVKTANLWTVAPPRGVTVVYAFSVARDTKRLAALLQRWANQVGHTIDCVMYGHELPGQEPVRKEGAHLLYSFTPLQSE